ncbi:YitT family protein [Bacillus sp. SLBN-3]
MKLFKTYLIIVIGAFLMALNIHFFLTPNNLALGGTSGAAIVLAEVINLPVGALMLALDASLFLLGLILIGPAFGIRSVIATLILNGFVWGMESFFPVHQPISPDVLVQVVIGTLLGAVGVAMIFYQEASAGGTGVLAQVLHRFINVELGTAVLLSDVLIVLASAFLFGLQTGLYAFFGLILKGLLVDKSIQFFNERKEVVIISEKSEDIRGFIIHELHKGATVHSARGGFSEDDKEVITTILERKDFSKLKAYIQATDKEAFITVHSMHEIWGRNFRSFA